MGTHKTESYQCPHRCPETLYENTSPSHAKCGSMPGPWLPEIAAFLIPPGGSFVHTIKAIVYHHPHSIMSIVIKVHYCEFSIGVNPEELWFKMQEKEQIYNSRLVRACLS